MMTHFGKPFTVGLLSTLLGASTTLFGVNGNSDTNVGSEYSRANDVDIIKKKDMPIHLAWTKEPVNNVKKHLSKLHIQTNEKDKHRRDDIKKDEEIEWKKNDTAEGIDHHDMTSNNREGLIITHDSLAPFEAMMKQHASMARIGNNRRRRNDRRHLQDYVCVSEIEELIFCGATEPCLECMLETTEAEETFDGCSGLEEYFCEELSDCESSCGSSFMDEVFEVMDCILNSIDELSSCSLADCPAETTSEEDEDEDDDPPTTDDYYDTECFPEALAAVECGIPESCAVCALEAMASRLLFVDCSDFENHLCLELSYCELQCGASCMDEVVGWIDCSYQINDDFALCSLLDCPWL